MCRQTGDHLRHIRGDGSDSKPEIVAVLPENPHIATSVTAAATFASASRRAASSGLPHCLPYVYVLEAPVNTSGASFLVLDGRPALLQVVMSSAPDGIRSARTVSVIAAMLVVSARGGDRFLQVRRPADIHGGTESYSDTHSSASCGASNARDIGVDLCPSSGRGQTAVARHPTMPAIASSGRTFQPTGGEEFDFSVIDKAIRSRTPGGRGFHFGSCAVRGCEPRLKLRSAVPDWLRSRRRATNGFVRDGNL